ncbi:MAG: CoA pyrophosphatase [Promethearchaeota archaeon]
MKLGEAVDAVKRGLSNLSPRRVGDVGVKLKPAAVLVCLFERDAENGARLAFVERSRGSKDHRGEVAFPGGRFEPGTDEDLESTALREAEEEIGLPADQVEVLGLLGEIWTVTGYLATPVVGVAWDPPQFVAQAEEVRAIHEIPLSHLLDPRNFQESVAKWAGGSGRTKFPMFFFFWRRVVIFGATAYVLFDFLREFFGFAPPLKRDVASLEAVRSEPNVIREAIGRFEKARLSARERRS